MRLGLIDRLRRLARWRETAGRHRIDVASRNAAPQYGAAAAGNRDPEARLARETAGRGAEEPCGQVPLQPPAGVFRRQLAEQARSPRQVMPWGRPAVPAGFSSRLAGTGPVSGGGAGRARIRERPQEQGYGAAPVEAVAEREPWYQVVTEGQPARRGNGQAGPRAQALPQAQAQALQGQAQAQQARARQATATPPARLRLPYVPGHPPGHPATADGRVNCGPLEKILHRQWREGTPPPPAVVLAVNRLAALPRHLQQKLADGLTGIFVGPGGVPELDDMGALKGVRLPSGRATWDACAGAYGERKLVVGSRQSPTPDVMCHEVGHALDDLDSPAGKWQSDSAEFKAVYDQCKPHLVSDFHRQRGGLGRKEFFADAFAAIASGQRPALVDMLGGDTRTALWVMLYFNRRYGI
jgi:hypothetical protein